MASVTKINVGGVEYTLADSVLRGEVASANLDNRISNLESSVLAYMGDMSAAISEKGGAIAEDAPLSAYADSIRTIPNVEDIDLSFITATANDILAGKVGSDVDGNPVNGTIQTVTASLSGNVVTVPAGYHSAQTLTVAEASAPTVSGNEVTVYKGYQSAQTTVTVGVAKSADTITPGTTDVIIPAGTYLLGMQLIPGDANLLAENIKAGVTIFGITGIYEGSGGGGDGYIFPTEGLLCHFNMNDSGTKAADDVNGIELTAYGNVTAQEPSFRGTAWKASASGDYLAGNNNVFTLPQNFTINAFINYSGNGVNEWRTVVDFGGQKNGEGFGIWLKYGAPAYRIGSSYGSFGSSLTTNSWHMLTMTFNGLSTAMYIDGELTNSISVSKTITNATTINMFKRRDYSDCFYGSLDEVSLWNYAMSEEEVQSLMDYYNNTEEEDTGGSDSGGDSGDSDITTYNYSELDTDGDAYVDSDQLSKLFVPVGEKVRIKIRFASPDKDTIYTYITTTGCQFSGIDTLEELEDNVRLLAEDGTVKYTSYQNLVGEFAIKEDNLPNGNYYIEIDNTEGTAQVSMTGFSFHAYGDATGISDWVESGESGGDSGSASYAFSISGITNPTEANGNYIEQSSGVYKHETNEYYVSREMGVGDWCLAPTVNPTNTALCNFHGYGSSGVANPWEVTEWRQPNGAVLPGAGTVVITQGGSDSGNGGESGGDTPTPVYRVTHMNNGEEVGDYWDSGLLSKWGRPIYTNGVCYLGYDDNSSFTYIRTIAEFEGPYGASEYLFRSKDATRLPEGVHTGDYEPGSARDYPYAMVTKL